MIVTVSSLTPEDVCKVEFSSAFRLCSVPSSPIPSNYIQSTDSLISPSEYTLLDSPIYDDSSFILSLSQFDLDATVQGLLSNLCITSPSINHLRTPVHIQHLGDCLDNANDQCNAIVVHFRARIEEATHVIQELESRVERIDSLRNIVYLASGGKLLARELTPLRPRNSQRDSQDSQITLSSEQVSFTHSRIHRSKSCPFVCVGTQTSLLDFMAANLMTKITDDWIDTLCDSFEPVACKTHFKDLWNVERELTRLTRLPSTSTDADMSSKLHHLFKKKAKLETKILDLTTSRDKASRVPLSGPSRMKAWLKRFVTQDIQPAPRKLEIVLDLDEERCCVGREARLSAKKLYDDLLDYSIDTALRTSQVVLDNARRDLQSIHNHLAAVRSRTYFRPIVSFI